MILNLVGSRELTAGIKNKAEPFVAQPLIEYFDSLKILLHQETVEVA